MVESHPDAPEVHRGPECLADRFPEDSSLVHVRVEIFLSSVQRHELLIILQLPGGSEVCQLVDDGPVVLDELHDVARLQVPAREAEPLLLRMLRYYTQIVFITLNLLHSIWFTWNRG